MVMCMRGEATGRTHVAAGGRGRPQKFRRGSECGSGARRRMRRMRRVRRMRRPLGISRAPFARVRQRAARALTMVQRISLKMVPNRVSPSVMFDETYALHPIRRSPCPRSSSR